MDEVARLLTLLAIVGGALTVVGGAFAWALDEERRIRRTFAKALGEVPQLLLTARGRGLGVGFDLAKGVLAVTWDKGAWVMTYRVDELMGVELVTDRQVAARAFRGEARRPLDHLDYPQERVRLRFVFDDAEHPDFAIDLWRPEDEGRRGRLDPDEALHEANRWVSRMESLLRRPIPARLKPAVAAPAPPRTAPPSAGPLFAEDETDGAFGDDPEEAIT